MGGGNKKNKKKPKTKEHKRRTSSVVGKKSLATDNDYTGSCIQPTNQRRCLKKKKKTEKVFRGKTDCSANGRGQVLKLRSILANQFVSLLGRSGEEVPLVGS